MLPENNIGSTKFIKLTETLNQLNEDILTNTKEISELKSKKLNIINAW